MWLWKPLNHLGVCFLLAGGCIVMKELCSVTCSYVIYLKRYTPLFPNYNFTVEPSNGWCEWNEPLSVSPHLFLRVAQGSCDPFSFFCSDRSLSLSPPTPSLPPSSLPSSFPLFLDLTVDFPASYTYNVAICENCLLLAFLLLELGKAPALTFLLPCPTPWGWGIHWANLPFSRPCSGSLGLQNLLPRAVSGCNPGPSSWSLNMRWAHPLGSRGWLRVAVCCGRAYGDWKCSLGYPAVGEEDESYSGQLGSLIHNV